MSILDQLLRASKSGSGSKIKVTVTEVEIPVAAITEILGELLGTSKQPTRSSQSPFGSSNLSSMMEEILNSMVDDDENEEEEDVELPEPEAVIAAYKTGDFSLPRSGVPIATLAFWDDNDEVL